MRILEAAKIGAEEIFETIMTGNVPASNHRSRKSLQEVVKINSKKSVLKYIKFKVQKSEVKILPREGQR